MNPRSVIFTWKNTTDKILHDELVNVGTIHKLTKNTKDSFLTAVQFQLIWKYAENGISPENQKIAKKLIKEMLNDTFIPEFRKQQLIETVKDKIDLK